jgi:carbamoyl-phosphate synthase large subunit
MSERLNIAVSGVGGDVGQGVVKSLEISEFDINFFLLSSDLDSAFLYLYKNTFLSPKVIDPDYLNFVKRFIVKFEIQLFIPTIDSEIFLFAEAAQEIEMETGCKVFVNSSMATAVTQDKWKTFKFLRDSGFATPHTVVQGSLGIAEFRERSLYPLISKPRKGAGSRNIKVIYDETQLDELQNNHDYILQEYLGDELDELTCGVYLDDSLNVIGVSVLKRKLKNGSTNLAERIFLPRIEGEVTEVAKRLGTKYLNIQGKLDGYSINIFELNGRLSGTVSMVSKIFNAPELYIREKFNNEKLQRNETLDGFVSIRFQEEIYTTVGDMEQLIQRSQGI